VVFLAEDETLHTVFARIETLLSDWK
jgi:hypothetical protein